MIDQLVRLVTIWVQMDVKLVAHQATGKTLSRKHVNHAMITVRLVQGVQQITDPLVQTDTIFNLLPMGLLVIQIVHHPTCKTLKPTHVSLIKPLM